MYRYDIINKFIKERNFKKYLEIGVHNKNDNFNKINCETKICVDPDSTAQADYILTSDNFFSQNTMLFDIIFIDGMHEAHQVYRDIQNALKCLNINGIIVCHDCNPLSLKAAGDWEEFSKEKYGAYCWNGDCLKAFVKYRNESSYECYVLNTDSGCGIIDTSKNTKIKNKTFYCICEMTYSLLNSKRKELLDLRNP